MDRLTRDDIEAAAIAVTGVRVYVLWATELPPADWRPGIAAICFRNNGDADYRTVIGDRWRGRGLVIGVCLRTIRTDALALRPHWPRVPIRRLFDRMLLSTFAHELAHVARDCNPPKPDDPLPEPSTKLADVLQVLAAAGADFSPGTMGGYVPFAAHDARFFRAACHVGHRLAETLDYQFLLELFSEGVGLSSSWHYSASLGDETERLAHLPLAEIDGIAPPDVFQHVWCSDIRRWYGGLDTPSNAQTEALISALRLFTPS